VPQEELVAVLVALVAELVAVRKVSW